MVVRVANKVLPSPRERREAEKTLANHVDNDATERVRRVAQQPLSRLWGGNAHCHWSVVERYNVWRVRRVETGETVIVKASANVALIL